MAKVKRVIRCYHCGKILQSDDPNESNYVPKEFLEDQRALKDRILYCQSCYDALRDINNGELNQNVDDEILKILDDARASDAMIVYVIDLFSFNGTFKKAIIDKIRKLNIAVVATKRDLLPKNASNERLTEYIKERFEEVGIVPSYIRILDLKSDEDIKDVMNKCLVDRRSHDVYMIGEYTSGKTTIITRCLKFYENKTRKQIGSRIYRGTKINVFQIPLSNSTYFYELPGLALDLSVVGKVERDVQKILIPKKNVSVDSYNLNAGESVVVGGLAAFSVTKGPSAAIKLYTAENVESKKINYNKVDIFLRENFTKRNNRPVSSKFATFHDYDIFEYAMENDNKSHDISIEGLGWISFIAKGQTIQILVPRGCALKESLSKIMR